MGGNQSTTVKSQESLAINHPRFVDNKVVKKGSEEFIQIVIPLSMEGQFKTWEQSLKEAPQNKELFLMPVSYHFKKEGLCGSGGFLCVQYENYPFILGDQISSRANLDGKIFQEKELWYLLYSLLKAASEFHLRGSKVGDIRPDNVFINCDGEVKISTVYSWPGSQTNYHKTFYEKEITYLSPEQLRDIHFGKTQTSANYETAEAFSIGLSVLDAATLQKCKTFLTNIFKPNYQQLRAIITKFNKSDYSQIFKLIINNICEFQPQRRQTCTELYRWLSKYEQPILNLEDFQIQGLTDKLGVQYERMKSSPTKSPINGQSPSHSNIRHYDSQQGSLPNIDSKRQKPQQAKQRPQRKNEPIIAEEMKKTQSYENKNNNDHQIEGERIDLLKKIDQQLENSKRTFPS